MREIPDNLSQGRGQRIECIDFLWRADRSARAEGVHLETYGPDALRGALAGERRGERADLASVAALFAVPGGES